MRNIYTVFTLILLFSGSLHAGKITFGYDAAGNRISRATVVLKSGAGKLQEQESPPEPLTEALDTEREIKIYPNPVKSMLMVEITGGDNDDLFPLSLFNTKGELLQSFRTDSSMLTIDMTGYSEGMYILKLQLPERTATYKIIKQ